MTIMDQIAARIATILTEQESITFVANNVTVTETELGYHVTAISADGTTEAGPIIIRHDQASVLIAGLTDGT